MEPPPHPELHRRSQPQQQHLFQRKPKHHRPQHIPPAPHHRQHKHRQCKRDTPPKQPPPHPHIRLVRLLKPKLLPASQARVEARVLHRLEHGPRAGFVRIVAYFSLASYEVDGGGGDAGEGEEGGFDGGGAGAAGHAADLEEDGADLLLLAD